MLRFFALAALSLGGAFSVLAQGGHEYAPLQEKTVDYKDWTFKSLTDDAPVNLREWAGGKRLVLIVYFAEWCPNWRNEAPVLARLYKKYAPSGLGVIAVSEYAARDDVRKFFGKEGPPYMVVVESDDRAARDKTTHFAFRQACGDARKWGSPYNVFLDPATLTADGEVLARRIWVVNGELIEDKIEEFLRERLGVKEQ